MNGRAEIDTRPPFSSVKEAVSLFTPHLQEFAHESKSESSIAELKKAQRESKSMENEMYTLKEELEKTKRELKELKELQESKRQFTRMMADLQDMEDLKYVKMSDEEEMELQKKRYVTSKIALPTAAAVLERHPSLKKKKKAFTIPFIGAIFPKRKTKCGCSN